MLNPGDYCVPNRNLPYLRRLLTYEVERVVTPSLRVQINCGTKQIVYLVGDGWPRRAEDFRKVSGDA